MVSLIKQWKAQFFNQKIMDSRLLTGMSVWESFTCMTAPLLWHFSINLWDLECCNSIKMHVWSNIRTRILHAEWSKSCSPMLNVVSLNRLAFTIKQLFLISGKMTQTWDIKSLIIILDIQNEGGMRKQYGIIRLNELESFHFKKSSKSWPYQYIRRVN